MRDAHVERPATGGLKTVAVWVVGHASKWVPVVVISLVVGATWQALRTIHPRDVERALKVIDMSWLVIAGAITLANIAVMGLYDVLAFDHTRARASDRWRYGAVAFAWSNFLTLGPFAGPAIRFWLYRPTVSHVSDLENGVLSITIAFASGLVGWTVASVLVTPGGTLAHLLIQATASFALVYGAVYAGRLIAVRVERFDDLDPSPRAALGPAIIGWLDWLLASLAFLAALRATGQSLPIVETVQAFFFGQAIGLASLVPGGFGSGDAFWIAHLPLAPAVAAAALVGYRLVYYVLPWGASSLVLLSWATRRASRRVELARRIVAGLVAAGGAVMLVSTASPALYSRLTTLESIVPLPLVEASHATAALTGILLLVLARGLAKGYRSALGTTIVVLLLASVSALLKGLDYEESLILAGLAVAAWSQSPLFDRESHGAFFTGRDLAVAALALLLFVGFGLFAHNITPDRFDRIRYFGYEFQRARYLRTAGTMVLGLAAMALYVALRVPVKFRRPEEAEIDQTLELHAAIGRGTSLMMVANGDKEIFRFEDRGLCVYRTIGPYLVVFSDPDVADPEERDRFLDALFAYAAELDRRPIFYQVSLEWIPPLHDRGYAFFKLGEEAHVMLNQVTVEGPQGKLYRQIIRRGERDRLRMRVLAPFEVEARMAELRAISDEWLEAKEQTERQFSIGFFDERYLRRFPCAIVEQVQTDGSAPRLLAFANLLRGPKREEFSIDLMRYRTDGPSVMDFLFVSLFFHAKDQGYRRFNLGMAPLASVGRFRGAHGRERLANLLFRHGENWYNFQGLRFYKQKFDPEWVPRYMAYQSAWEWAAAITHVSALVAGGWKNVVLKKDSRLPEPAADQAATEQPA